MSKHVAPPTSRALSAALTYDGARRTITATLDHGDPLNFTLGGFGPIGGLDLMPLVWQAIRANPAGAKHPLQPRTCQGKRPYVKGDKPLRAYSRMYGISIGQLSKMRSAGAPLDDPDRMGDYIFALPRRGGTKRRKAVFG